MFLGCTFWPTSNIGFLPMLIVTCLRQPLTLVTMDLVWQVSDMEGKLKQLDAEKEELAKYQAVDKERRSLEYAIYNKDISDTRTKLEQVTLLFLSSACSLHHGFSLYHQICTSLDKWVLHPLRIPDYNIIIRVSDGKILSLFKQCSAQSGQSSNVDLSSGLLIKHLLPPLVLDNPDLMRFACWDYLWWGY